MKADGGDAAYALTINKWKDNVRDTGRLDFVSLQVEPTPASQLGNGITEIDKPKISDQLTDKADAIIDINESGKSQRFENRPPYYVLAYIMRVS